MRTKMISPFAAGWISVVGIFFFGYLDYVTGTEIRVFPLYFIPLIFAALHLGNRASVGLSVLAATVWLTSMYFGGQVYSHPLVWVMNFLTQGAVFLLVTVLFSYQNRLLDREYTLSRIDALTGLYNSRAFYEQADPILKLSHRETHPVTVAYIDLDNFKHANDVYGHLYGDDLLRTVANVLRASFRSSDIIARMGGDEFVVLFPETNANNAKLALEKMQQRLMKSPKLLKAEVTVSIGAVSYRTAPTDLDSLINEADETMYKIKYESKNGILIEER